MHDRKVRYSVRVSCTTSGSHVECHQTSDDSDGAISIGEMHFAGPVPDEGDYPTELEGKRRVDGTWIDPKLLSEGRKEEMGVHEWECSKLLMRKSATTR